MRNKYMTEMIRGFMNIFIIMVVGTDVYRITKCMKENQKDE